MNRWTVVVPLKDMARRKSRLAKHLSVCERNTLTDQMFRRVVAAVSRCPLVERVVVLSPEGLARWRGPMLIDLHRGLNDELSEAALALGERQIAVIHADLPKLQTEDVSSLLTAAGTFGGAVALDRHGTGTNALALRSTVGFSFCFGPGSAVLHIGQRAGIARIDRSGFAFDLDTLDDLHLAVQAGAVPMQCNWVAT